MKKVILICTLVLCLLLCSCGEARVLKEQDIKAESNISMFVEVERSCKWIVVYHIETKVMYVISDGDYNRGLFTLLVNADGTPMVYGG